MSETDSTLKNILLQNEYVLMEQIGVGGFATCYNVWSQKYQTTFVCKVYKAQDNADKDKVGAQLNQFSHEIEALVKIFQTYIMRIYSYFMTNDMFFMILEYCPNGSIQDMIKHEGKIDGNKLNTYLYQAATALEYCHSKSFAHHDIKPANLLIDENFNIKLSDFGMAEPGTCHCEKYGGTLAFLAPEIFLRQPYDPFKADVWSFGATAFFMACGTAPFTGSNPTEMKQLICNGCYIMPNTIPPYIKKLIKNTMVLSPEARWSMTNVVDYLKGFLETKITPHNSMSGIYLSSRNSTLGKNRVRRRNSIMVTGEIRSPLRSSTMSRLLDTFAE
ncbi:CAMK family protein kinase [Trichomonas vaginalis G3]|uniref:CAMK family protein kinase n=1 Tax=Trichomonas vaginalis (strain ATCC PRA-98 / G3) TaxID=412133 RepID=A2DAN9_TRIV3|nr:protein serine/threonine kinase protein [Trichomonas vaginalis G3]EAY22542.1 CAMK family protein kinase [Trichomonas vaginalis G3]KAI5497275.1 protein serine/threonine kinase protein [Trichomonas vaginalis G3]|eukprot:XP_001583528.1 CAMK family protein kinase [Trichomonas vaginalis G3]